VALSPWLSLAARPAVHGEYGHNLYHAGGDKLAVLRDAEYNG
jgi:hypothetical protein